MLVARTQVPALRFGRESSIHCQDVACDRVGEHPVPESCTAEQASGGQATGDVEPAEQTDPVEDPNDQPTPKGAAYEVEITKDGQALKVFLDSSFHAVETQQDAG